MNTKLNAKQILILWRLAVAGGGDWKKDVKPNLDTGVRKPLETFGLIRKEKRKSPTGRGKPLFFSLTDEGWGWLSENLEANLKTSSPAGNVILERLLGRLKVYLDKSNLSLAELMLPSDQSTAGSAVSLEDQITRAYSTISNGQTNVRVRLYELRAALPSVPRVKFDEALLELAMNGKAALYRLDNPTDIRAEDREAVLFTPGGEERHIVYLGGRGS